jgi:hypothetical protein
MTSCPCPFSHTDLSVMAAILETQTKPAIAPAAGRLYRQCLDHRTQHPQPAREETGFEVEP